MSTMLQTIQQQHCQDLRDRLERAGVSSSWQIEMYCRHLAIVLKQMHLFELCVRPNLYQASPLNEYQRRCEPRSKFGINIQRANLNLTIKTWKNAVCYLDSRKEYWLGNWNSTSALLKYHLRLSAQAEQFYRLYHGLSAEIHRLRDVNTEPKTFDRLVQRYRELYEIRKVKEYLRFFLRILRFILSIIRILRAVYEYMNRRSCCAESQDIIDLAIIVVRFLFVVSVRYACEIFCLCHYFVGLFIG